MHEPFESLVELTPDATRGRLRGFGLGVAALCAWLTQLAGASQVAAGALWTGAVLVALAAWLRPQWLRSFHRWVAWLSFPLRWLLASCALIVLFFGVLTPTAWIVRRLRKPSASAAGSAWLQARPRRSKAHYFEQS
jgi:hypothetical protein